MAPPKIFHSDGISFVRHLAPQEAALYVDCGIAHDYFYWLGGTEQDRKEADALLYLCLLRHGAPQLRAWVYWKAVRMAGRRHFTYKG